MKKILFILVIFLILVSSVYAEEENLDKIPSHTVPVPNAECGQGVKKSIVLNTNLNCPGDGLVVGKSGITIDCNGKTIKYALSGNGYGVKNIGYDNVELKNCKIITDSSYLYNSAMYFKNVKSINIKNNEVDAPNSIGIEGINFEGNIENNQVNAVNGIYATGSGYLSIKNNEVVISKASGIGIGASTNDEAIVSGNNVESAKEQTSGIIFGGLNALITDNNVNVKGNGIHAGYGSDITISNNEVGFDGQTIGAGISMLEVSNSNVYGNDIITSGNDWAYGMKLWWVSESLIEDNTINSEDSFAIFLWDSNHNILKSNNIIKAVEGVHMKPFDANCEDNILMENEFDDVAKFDLYLGRDGFGGSDNTKLINQEIRKYSIQSNKIIIEDEEGILEYLNPIKVTGNSLDEDIKLMENSISVEKDELNERAKLTFKDLEIDSPIALMDGNVCPSNICSAVTQQGGDYSYTVEHFTEYSVGESINEGPKSVSCGDTITANTFLTSDLNCAGDGLILGANGITLDCNGHTIVYANSASGHGVQIVNHNNVEVINCNIVKGSYSGSLTASIKLDTSPNCLIGGNIISTNSNANFGISLTKSNNVVIQDNEISNNGAGTRGISLGSNQENIQIKNNQINSLNSDSRSISLNSDSMNTTILNNSIDSEGVGIYIDGSAGAPEYTTISNNEINADMKDLIVYLNVDNLMLLDQDIGSYQISSSKIQIKKTNIGEVWFDEYITVSGAYLDNDVNIQDNDISIDIVNKPDFNVPGTIKFYNPTTRFAYPYYALMNDERCTAPYGDVCSNFEHDDVFSFDVSEMALKFSVDGSTTQVPEEKKEKENMVVEENKAFSKENKVVKIIKESNKSAKKAEEIKPAPRLKPKTTTSDSSESFYSFYI